MYRNVTKIKGNRANSAREATIEDEQEQNNRKVREQMGNKEVS